MSFAHSQAAFAEALLDPAQPPPQGLTSARGESDTARFAVYRNNVFVGLTNALAKRFPVVGRLVGSDFFAGMARAYAATERPSSPLLFHYGDSFAAFIERFEPARSLPYLADVARLEAAWTHAYHAADERPAGMDALGAVDPEKIAAIRAVPHPSATLLVCRHPVGSVWAAHQSDPVSPIAQWNAETVLVVRPALDVHVHILPTGDAGFAAALFEGKTLGEAAESAFANDPVFDFGSALVGLVSLGAFRALTIDEGTPS